MINELVHFRDPTEIYITLEKIGEGSAGEVYKSVNKINSKQYGVKKICIDHEKLKQMTTEICIMNSNHHPNIVSYIESYLYHNHIWVVMEYMDGGSLAEALEQFSFIQMNEGQIALVCREVISLREALRSLRTDLLVADS